METPILLVALGPQGEPGPIVHAADSVPGILDVGHECILNTPLTNLFRPAEALHTAAARALELGHATCTVSCAAGNGAVAHPLQLSVHAVRLSDQDLLCVALKEPEPEPALHLPLATVLDSITDGFFHLDRQARFTYLNGEAERILRKPRAEVTGRSIWEVFPEAVGTPFQQQYERAVTSGQTVHFVEYYAPYDVWYEVHGYPSDEGLAVYCRDVTDRVRAQEALRESRHHLAEELERTRLLQQVSTELIQADNVEALYERILDAAVAVLHADFASLQMLHPERGPQGELRLLGHRGFTAEAAAHWEWVQPTSRCTWGTVLRTGQRVVTPDVETCELLAGSEDLAIYRQTGIRALQTTPLVSRSGVLLGMLSTHWRQPHTPTPDEFRTLDILARQAADLIERKRMEAEVRSLAQFPEENPSPVMRVAGDGRVVYANAPARRLMTEMGWYTDGMLHEPLREVAARVLAEGAVLETEFACSRGRVFNFTLSPSTEEGRVNLYGRDITQRKRVEEALRESESFYRQTLESIPGMVFTTRPDGYCDYQSQQWVDYTGVPMSEHLGDGWNTLLHPEDRPRAHAAWRAAVEGRAPYDLEYRVRRHDGEYEWFKVIARPIRDTAGRTVRWFGVAANIHALKQAEDALKEWNETLERRVAQRTVEVRRQAEHLRLLATELTMTGQRERKRLADILHDDLQQILVAARMRLERVQQIPDCTAEPRSCREALAAAEKLLAESIRISRSVTAELRPPVLYEGGLVPALRWLAEHMLQRHELAVVLEAQDVMEPEDIGQRALLYECVRELLFNIVKHAGVKEARLAITGTLDGFLHIRVEDRGTGFDRGAQADRPSFGLLSVSERLAAIGGRMDLDSRPGEGTRVDLFAPVSAEHPLPEEPLVEILPPATAACAERGKAIRVLLVDDHRIMREGIALLFAGEPRIQVVGEAADGEEAVRMTQTLQPDVVVMDVNMPKMSGIDATRHITQQMPRVKVIALSMHQDPQVERTMRDAGAVDYVTKEQASESLLLAIFACTDTPADAASSV